MVKKTIKQEEKKWYQSKTVWINALGIAAGIISAIQGELLAGGAISGASLINLILRVVTKGQIKFK